MAFWQRSEVRQEGLPHGYCVALLVLGVLTEVLLLAVVGQVDFAAEIIEVVGGGGGAQVGRVVVEDVEVGRDEHPDPDVELAAIVEEGFFDGFLNYP